MLRAALALAVAGLAACGSLSVPPPHDGGGVGGGGAGGGGVGGGGAGGGGAGGGGVGGGGAGGGGAGGGGTGGVDVTTLYPGRSRPGARSAAAFRPWRGGLAIIGAQLYWVESGTAPGLYRAPLTGCATACVERLATVTRPSAFATTGESVLVADVTALRRYAADGGVQAIATGSTELVAAATDGVAAFWTTESGAIQRTPFGGATSTPINSNGTPWVMTVAGTRVYWTGVDISGLQAVLQSMRTDGTGAREESRSANGFETMRGDGAYLYYAKDSPARVVRVTLSNGFVEEVATNCQGVKDFALDATHAWWVEPGTGPDYANGRVRRVAHDSTVPETMAVSVQLPVAIAAQGGVAWVASAGRPSTGYADGAILRVAPR